MQGVHMTVQSAELSSAVGDQEDPRNISLILHIHAHSFILRNPRHPDGAILSEC